MDDSKLPTYWLRAHADIFQGRYKCENEHSQFSCPGCCGDDAQDALTHVKIFDNGDGQAGTAFHLRLRRDRPRVDDSRNTQTTVDEAYARLGRLLESLQAQGARIREVVTPFRKSLHKTSTARPDIEFLTLDMMYPVKIMVDTFSDLVATSGQPVLGDSHQKTTILLREQRVLKLFWEDGFLQVVNCLQETSKEYADDSIKWLLGYICAYTAVALGNTVSRLTDQCSVKQDLVRYRALIFSRLSINFPSDRKLWQDAAHLEARAMIGERDDISGANHILGLVRRDSLRRLHSLALARYFAGHQNEGIEDALEELFEEPAAGDDKSDGDPDDVVREFIQFSDSDAEDTPEPAVTSCLGLQGDDRGCLKDWLEVYQLVAFPPSSAKKSTPKLDSFVKALEKSLKAGGKEKAEFGRMISIELFCILLSHTAKVPEMGPRVRLDAKVVENATSLISRVTEVVARVGRPVHTLPFWVNVLAFILHISGDEKMLERYRSAIPWGDVVAWLNDLTRGRFSFVSSGPVQDPSVSSTEPKVSVELDQEPDDEAEEESKDGETAKEEDKDGEKTVQQDLTDKSPTKTFGDESIQNFDSKEQITGPEADVKLAENPDSKQQSTEPEADGKSAEPTPSSIADVVKSPSSLFLLPQAKTCSINTKALRSHIQDLQGLDWAEPAFKLLQDYFGSDIDGRLQDDAQLEKTKPEPEENKPTPCEPDGEKEKGMIASIFAILKKAVPKSITTRTTGGAHTFDGLDDRRKKGALTPFDYEVILIDIILHLALKIVNRRTTPLRIELDEKRKQCYFINSDPQDPSNGGTTEDALADTTVDTASKDDVEDEEGDPDSFGELMDDLGYPEKSEDVNVSSASSSCDGIETPPVIDEDDKTEKERGGQPEPAENDVEKQGANKDRAATTETIENSSLKSTSSGDPASVVGSLPSAAASNQREYEQKDLDLDSGDIFKLDLDVEFDNLSAEATPENHIKDSEPGLVDEGETVTMVTITDPKVENEKETTITRFPKKSGRRVAGEGKQAARERKQAARKKRRTEEKQKEAKATTRFLQVLSFLTRPLIKYRDEEFDKPVKPSQGDQVLFHFMSNGNVTIPMSAEHVKLWEIEKKDAKEKKWLVMSPAQIRRMTWITLPQWARELNQLFLANPRLFALYTVVVLGLVAFLMTLGLVWWLVWRLLMTQSVQLPAAAAAPSVGPWERY
ncbi:hypothetical protein GP486_006204 [Trichoglossum hirsutum]|uniref:Uncharacterized protein n=1 Tax=Trichoglossum hirsutum TaxID=265104 RepID=A0A9P8IIW4_9PEZI|nr:hypothetical protein GP486_006204 [Trichoglossum hirsutum]